jgi:membrane-associated phospholipid phosphatase
MIWRTTRSNLGTAFSKIRENVFVFMLAGYVVVVLAWYVYFGVLFQFTLGVFFLILLPLTLLIGRTTRFVREITPFLVLLLSYEALQGIEGSLDVDPVIQIGGPHHSASTHNLVGLVQATFYSPTLTTITSFLYGLHFPLVAVLAVLLWYSDKTLYKRYVFSLVACSYVSLLFYVLLPSAPPWYTGVASNLLQTSSQQSSSGLYGTLVKISEMIESDKLAAFPSLHAAYIALFCYFTVRLNKIYGLVSIPITIGVLFSTIYLGQHFIVDLVAGAGVAASCVLLAGRIGEYGAQLLVAIPSRPVSGTDS